MISINSIGLGKTLRFAASHQGLRCLPQIKQWMYIKSYMIQDLFHFVLMTAKSSYWSKLGQHLPQLCFSAHVLYTHHKKPPN